MTRHFNDWLSSYVEYASYSEAPKKMHFFSAVAALAGALRRHVWLDLGYFKWFPNHYVILVAPPGVVSKSTTASIAMNLLRKVKGVNFGPDVVTWPALVVAFEAVKESFQYDEALYPQCALTLESSEFGNLINPQDREMVDLLVNLWDSKTGAFNKNTKSSGSNSVENPYINLIACTTPAWIAGNFPEYLIGGGFTSRCLFVYAEEKEKLVPYPHLEIPPGLKLMEERLVEDLEAIATQLVGPYTLDDSALEFGDAWYRSHHTNPPSHLKDDRFGGYLARKQTHLHKLGMVLAAASSEELIITADHLLLASTMLTTIETDLQKVFSKIGRSSASVQAERFLKFVQASDEPLHFKIAYQYIHDQFPSFHDYENMLKGLEQAGHIEVILKGGQSYVQHTLKRSSKLLQFPSPIPTKDIPNAS